MGCLFMVAAYPSICVNIHILQNVDGINSKCMKLGKGSDKVEDKGKNSVTTIQSNWRNDPTFTQICVPRGFETENISQNLKTTMISKNILIRDLLW